MSQWKRRFAGERPPIDADERLTRPGVVHVRAALNPLFWVAQIGGVKSYGRYQAGTPVEDPDDPAPTLPDPDLFTALGVGM